MALEGRHAGVFGYVEEGGVPFVAIKQVSVTLFGSHVEVQVSISVVVEDDYAGTVVPHLVRPSVGAVLQRPGSNIGKWSHFIGQ